ncbi:MAG: alpha/beta hydrolase-fold protein [Pseudomonadota bacterium]
MGRFPWGGGVGGAAAACVLVGTLLMDSAGAQTPADAPLGAGGQVQGSLAAMTTRAHGITAQPGDMVRGSLTGAGMRLVLTNAEGKRERVLATGVGGLQEFVWVAGPNPPYALEVRAPVAGSYSLRVTEVVTRAQQVPPPEVIESPRIRALQQALAAGGSTDAFWVEVQGRGTPLVEADAEPPKDGTVRVTFLWRGAQRNAWLFGAPSGNHDPLARLGDSDVWYRSYRVPAGTRLGYKLAPDVPELNASPMVRRRAILATAQRDPFNARSFPDRPIDIFAGESVFELPDAPPQPWVAERPGVPKGVVEPHRIISQALGNTRDVALYRPASWQPGASGNALLVLFDGDTYQKEVPTPTILDNLIAAGELPPMAAILISNPSRQARGDELPPHPAFARFLATELMPWARSQGVAAAPTRTVVAGASYGGLAAAYAGLQHPEWFGNVYSQSGSFWWSAPGQEPSSLTRDYVQTPVRPVRFYLEAGLFEGNRTGQVGILESTRHLRDVLRAKGYAVQHREYAAGHDYLHWRGTLATGLTALLGKKAAE